MTQQTALWKEQEKMLQKRLAILSRENKANAEKTESGDVRDEAEQEGETRRETRSSEKSIAQSNESTDKGQLLRERLYEKIGIRAGAKESVLRSVRYSAEPGTARETVLPSGTEAQERATWIARSLRQSDAADGYGESRESHAVIEESVPQNADTEDFSDRLERDARRYDGNFLYY